MHSRNLAELATYSCHSCHCRQPGIDNGQMQQHIQALRAAQAHMFELSQQVGIAELATELAEARAVFIERNAGTHILQTVSPAV